MANSKSSRKRVQVAERNRLRNQNYRSAVRTSVKRVHSLLEAGASEQDVQTAFQRAQSLIQRAVSKKIYKLNKASRDVSRLSKAITRKQEEASA